MQSPEPRCQGRRKLDLATLTLDLKVINPTIGNGRFLVTAGDFLSDRIIELMEYVAASDQFKRVIRFWGPGATSSVLTK